MNIKIKENRSQIVTGSIVCSTQQFAHMLSRSREWLFVFWGFAIPGNRFWLICYSGITNPPFSYAEPFLRRISNPSGRLSAASS